MKSKRPYKSLINNSTLLNSIARTVGSALGAVAAKSEALSHPVIPIKPRRKSRSDSTKSKTKRKKTNKA
jgi:hypothetical protein